MSSREPRSMDLLFVFVNMGPYGSKTSKRYSSIKSLLIPFKLFLNFLLNGPQKSTVLDFWNVGFLIFTNFGISPLYPMEKPKTQLSGKRATVEWNRGRFGPRGRVFSAHRVPLTLQWFRSFWGHSVHSDFWQVCIWKIAGRRAKRIEIWASGLTIQCTFDT